MILNSLTSVNQHAAKQREFWELPTVLCNCVQNFRHDPDVMLRLYLIRPHLEYCTAAWSPHYCKEFKKIHSHDSRPQGSPIRTETCKNQIMVTRARRTKADLIEVYKIIHGLSTIRFNTFFEFSHNERTGGHSEVT